MANTDLRELKLPTRFGKRKPGAAPGLFPDQHQTHLSAVNSRLNEIMKVLTVISVVFIPLNFMAGVFGMNFEAFPWKWQYAFPAFTVVGLILVFGMLEWFRRRGWL